MKLNFDVQNVAVVEFGVGRDDDDEQSFLTVPVDAGVQAALREMVQATWDEMQQRGGEPAKYEPSEKYGSTEYLHLTLADDLCSFVRQLHEAANLEIDTQVLINPSEVFCYFVRLVDSRNRRLTGLRRATQFKGILKSKGRLVRLLDDSLQIVDDTVFKLDADFDLLVDSTHVHILRPSGFEFAGNLQGAVLAAVPQNIQAIQKDLHFVDFAVIREYAVQHPRAARYLASIRSQKQTKNIDKTALRNVCRATGVDVRIKNGRLTVVGGHEMSFLEVLDRRRYELELVKGSPERFRAASRKKIEG